NDSGPGDADSAPAEPEPEPEPSDDSGPDAGEAQAQDAPLVPPSGAEDAAHDHDAPAPVSVAMPEDPFTTRLLAARRTGSGAAGRRSKAETTIGRTVGARRGDTGAVHLPATIRATAVRSALAGADPAADRGAAAVARRFGPGTDWDLRRKVVEGREANLVLLCVDASGSMAARKRMAQDKSAVISLLLDAYRRRDTVGLGPFRGAGPQLVLPPPGSVDVAARRMRELPAGGRTPLAEGLAEAGETIRRHRRRDPDLRALLIVVTDGRATAGDDAVDRSLAAADARAAGGLDAALLDAETAQFR